VSLGISAASVSCIVAPEKKMETRVDGTKLEFGNSDVAMVLARMSEEEIDALLFGAIMVDRHGMIQYYSGAEARLASRKAEDVLGKNFFREVAPCTNQKEFQGRFADGVKTGDLNAIFKYHFDFLMNPTDVQVHMVNATTPGTHWILVRKIGA
jgi:photoactive yellow protein